MSSSQLFLISVTSALVTVFAMLLVAASARGRRKGSETKTDHQAAD